MCYTVVVIDPLQNALQQAPITARTSIVTLDKEKAIEYCDIEMDNLEREGYEYTYEYCENGKSTVIYDKPGLTAAVVLQISALIQ